MESTVNTCGWRCGDPTPGHTHWAVVVRETSGKLLGRLTPEGTTTNRNLFAWVMSRAKAEQVAESINNNGEFVAKAIRF